MIDPAIPLPSALDLLCCHGVDGDAVVPIHLRFPPAAVRAPSGEVVYAPLLLPLADGEIPPLSTSNEVCPGNLLDGYRRELKGCCTLAAI